MAITASPSTPLRAAHSRHSRSTCRVESQSTPSRSKRIAAQENVGIPYCLYHNGCSDSRAANVAKAASAVHAKAKPSATTTNVGEEFSMHAGATESARGFDTPLRLPPRKTSLLPTDHPDRVLPLPHR